VTSNNGRARNDYLPAMPKIWTPGELLVTAFPDPRWAVPGLIPEGLTILAGAPKQGKSWLCYSLTLAIASGGVALGNIPVEVGEVLYLSLEDTPRRLKFRCERLTAGWQTTTLSNAQMVTEWPRMGRGGLKLLAHWLSQHPQCRLVIIDTLQKIRNDSAGQGRNAYEEDYRTASAIKTVADEFGIAIVIVHHLRKMASDDVYERVSGSNGLTGAADGVLIIRRERGKPDAVLFASGRDVEERELAIRFDPITASWTLLGDAAHFRVSAERQKILTILSQTERAMTPREIAGLIGDGTKEVNVKVLCYDMARDGQIRNAGDGRFIALPKAASVTGINQNPVTPVTPVTPGYPVTGPVTGTDDNPVTAGYPVTQAESGVIAVTGSNRVIAVTGSNRVPHESDQPMFCLDCGEPLPDGWLFRCPDCIDQIEQRIDPD